MTLDVHGKDVLTDLVKEGVTSNNDFKWLCQLRYYWQVRSAGLQISFFD